MDVSTSEVMTSKLVSIPAKTPLHEAYEIMEEKRIKQIPVVDDSDRVIGVLEKKAVELRGLPPDVYAEDFLSTPEVVSNETPLRTVILQMLQKKISYVLIVNPESEVVGIVSTDDLLWYLAHLLREQPAESKPLFSAKQIQTIGEISRELAEMGI